MRILKDAGFPGRKTLLLAFVMMTLGMPVMAADAKSDAQGTGQIGRPVRFESPEAAATALAAAFGNHDIESAKRIFGAGSTSILYSGDPVQDRNLRAHFTTAWAEGHRFAEREKGILELLVGRDHWPFPVPLVERASAAGGGWSFNLPAKKREILDWRFGVNQSDAMKVCRFLTAAQKEYYERNPMQSAAREYARMIVSSPGKKDGLYWPPERGEKAGPAGAVFAAIEREGYRMSWQEDGSALYHGYRFKVLGGQGPAAPGGAKSYLVDNRMSGGFALFAWPAQYGASGLKSFLCGSEGAIHSKDLGQKTDRIAPDLTLYNPGDGWKREEFPGQ
ncbi:MAG: DUF2950 domain-containing protein [Betaproteobacteria bacterium]|nr:DUF2950 domain-containing protein [Betaproteobacteria bacterium]